MKKITSQDREDLVYRLLYGEQILEINDRLYKLVNPTPKIKVLSNRIYDKTIKENRFGPFLKDRDCIRILVKNKLCSPTIDNNLKEIAERIDDLKVDLYECMLKEKEFEKTRKMLDAVKSKQMEMITTRHMFDYLTLKGYAEMVKRQYIIYHTLYDYETEEKIWDDWDKVNSRLMDAVISSCAKNAVGIDQLRDLARNDPWRSFWNTSKGNPFSIPASFMSEDQRAIIMFSKMYDNAYKHPECPPDDVINDDDLFDGWMISERRKKEKDQMTKQMENRIGGRHSSAEEIFIVPQGRDDEKKAKDRKRIESMNDTRAKIIRKQRQNQIKAKGKVTDSQFSDKRIEIQQEMNKKYIEKVKGQKNG